MKNEERDAVASVSESRREVEARLAELKRSIGRETGMVPSARYVILGMTAAAAGFALALRRKKRKRVAQGAG